MREKQTQSSLLCGEGSQPGLWTARPRARRHTSCLGKKQFLTKVHRNMEEASGIRRQVPLGEWEVKALIQRRASVRSLLYKPYDEGIKNRCALVGTRVRCAEDGGHGKRRAPGSMGGRRDSTTAWPGRSS